jgi:hypothetical protein
MLGAIEVVLLNGEEVVSPLDGKKDGTIVGDIDGLKLFLRLELVMLGMDEKLGDKAAILGSLERMRDGDSVKYFIGD